MHKSFVCIHLYREVHGLYISCSSLNISTDELRLSPRAGRGVSLVSPDEEGLSPFRSLVSGRESCWRTVGKDGRLEEVGCLYNGGNMVQYTLYVCRKEGITGGP